MAYKKLQIRRGLKSNLPTLASGELGFCTDTGELFIGNGTTNIGLAKAGDLSALTTTVGNKVDKATGKGLSTNDYTTAEKSKVTNLPSNTNTELGKKGNAEMLIANSVSVPTSAWTSNATYSDFPYRASIAITGCTANHKPDVTFSVSDAISGKFAPVAESYAGGVYIYASEIPTAAMTIPTIMLLLKKG